VCQLNNLLSLSGTCQTCLVDGTTPANRKCVSIYDCCSSAPLYQSLSYANYSICQPLVEYGTNYCKACIPDNGVCTEFDHCCNDMECSGGTCSTPEAEPDSPGEDDDRQAEQNAVDDTQADVNYNSG
jgi:hypothetical protein